MDWTALLKAEVEEVYRATEGLLDLVTDEELGWKPESGENWMSMAELLSHLGTACGWCTEHFVEDTWAKVMAEGPKEGMPAVASVAEAKEGLAKDKTLVLAMIDKAGEEDLATKPAPAPWNPAPWNLGRQVLSMIGHLNQHKGQLFYYLKLQGKPVNTMHLWGITPPEQPSTS